MQTLFHLPSSTNSSRISDNFYYWKTRCSPIACHFHTTGICRQEKCSCDTVRTGLSCGLQAGDCCRIPHTSLYHCSLAGISIHFVHCIARNFPWGGGESCCLLSELCKKPFFSLSRKSWAFQNSFDSQKAVGWVLCGAQNEWTDINYVNHSSLGG